MSTRITKFIEGEFYHIYNRGNSKQIIFHDLQDMEYFKKLLCISNDLERVTMRGSLLNEVRSIKEISQEENKMVAIGSYCLMPNHFHILLTPRIENGVSKFMQKLSTAYVMYYNKKYNHTGGLFEGKFKAKHCLDDRYLKYLFSYINLNPVKLIDSTWRERGIKNMDRTFKYLESYMYSSYHYFLNYKKSNYNKDHLDNGGIMSVGYFPEYFPTGERFKKEIILWLSYDEKI